MNSYYGYFAHYLVGVEVGIEEWITEGDKNQEDECTLVAKDAVKFVNNSGEDWEHGRFKVQGSKSKDSQFL